MAIDSKTYDVVIAGAGPTGLMLACELGIAGDVSVVVLERDDETTNATSAWKMAPLGIRGYNVTSAESFDRRGLLDQIVDPREAEKLKVFKQTGKKGGPSVGHFAGIMMEADKVDKTAACWKYKIQGPSLQPGMTSLHQTTQALQKRAQQLGIEIRAGMDITGLTQDAERGEVTVHVANAPDVRGKWLVGCDGGRSMVRKAAQFEFAGTEPELLGYTTLSELDDPHGRIKPGFQRTERGLYIKGFGGHLATMHPIGSEPLDRVRKVPTKDEFEAVLRRIAGHDDFSVTEMKAAYTYTDRSKQATTYRSGRVLLAGDSAHIHSPMGGQGMNAGIGDAVNLGWKLAAVVRGRCGEALLDSYTRERHPLGAWVLDWTRAQVATLRPDPFSISLAGLAKELMGTREGTTMMVDKLWGLTQRCDLSDHEAGEKLEDLHELVGRSVPDFEFADGSGRLAERMRSNRGHGLIIDFSEEQSALKTLARRWEDRVDYFGARAKNELGLRAVIIRPDGIVAWVAQAEPDLETAEKTLSRWFGAGEPSK